MYNDTFEEFVNEPRTEVNKPHSREDPNDCVLSMLLRDLQAGNFSIIPKILALLKRKDIDVYQGDTLAIASNLKGEEYICVVQEVEKCIVRTFKKEHQTD